MNIGFKSVHPVASFIFFVAVFLLCLASENPIILFIGILGGVVYELKLKGKKALLFILKFILPLIVLITIFNGFFNHYGVTVLFVMRNGNNFTLEALVYGFVSSLKISGMLLWLNCFNEIITEDKIIFLFGRFSPRIALVISMVLRFISLIGKQSNEIVRAEKGIGNNGENLNFIDKVKCASRRLSVLTSWTLEKGIDTSESMIARGYGLKGRTSYNNYIFTLRDGIISLFSIATMVLLVIFSDKVNSSYNPVIDIPAVDTFSIGLFIFILIVVFIPTMFDLRDERLWIISK